MRGACLYCTCSEYNFFLKNLGKHMKITSMGSAVSVLVLEDESGAR